MPESEIGYGPDAPKLTEEQLREFLPASYAIGQERASTVRGKKNSNR